MFILRFDFRRSPSSPATLSTLYATALEMAEWAEAKGALSVVVSEHHSSADGYLPSPMVLTSGLATRTTTQSLNISALLLLMYDPVKLAEDMVVLDHLSKGRVSYTIGLGYRPEEFAMFGVPMAERGRLIEERLDVLRRAFAGERFTYQGRTVHVTPEPFTPGGPPMAYGGGTTAAARRAARLGMAFLPQRNDPAFAEAYDDEARACGTTPGLTLAPPAEMPTAVFVAADLDEAWEDLGPYLLHDAMAYGAWLEGGPEAASRSHATSVAALRAENGAYRIVTPAEARALRDAHGALALHPLCGGIPPELAWPSLRLLEAEVL